VARIVSCAKNSSKVGCPEVGLINHLSDLSQNLVSGVIEFLKNLLAEIMMSKSNLDMDLGLGGFSLRVVEP
jgi:hypothetical protein